MNIDRLVENCFFGRKSCRLCMGSVHTPPVARDTRLGADQSSTPLASPRENHEL
jgi:hypothetical protein